MGSVASVSVAPGRGEPTWTCSVKLATGFGLEFGWVRLVSGCPPPGLPGGVLLESPDDPPAEVDGFGPVRLVCEPVVSLQAPMTTTMAL